MNREQLATVFTDDEIEELEQLMQDRADRARGRAVIDMAFVRALMEEEREDAAPWWKCRDAFVEDWRAKWEKKETERAEVNTRCAVIAVSDPSMFLPSRPGRQKRGRITEVVRPAEHEEPQSPSIRRSVVQFLRRAAAWVEAM